MVHIKSTKCIYDLCMKQNYSSCQKKKKVVQEGQSVGGAFIRCLRK